MKRIIGLDYGSKTVGVAISDPLGITAQGIEIIRRKSENKLRRTLARIDELAQKYGVEQIVLGLPLNMNSSLSDRARKSLEFREMISKRTGLNVIMWDERLTTVEAAQIMEKCGIASEEGHKYIDMIAAEIILQDYLDHIAIKKE